MRVEYRKGKYEKILNDRRELKRRYGDNAERIEEIYIQLINAETLDEISNYKDFHKLKGKMKGKCGISICGNDRMVVSLNGNTVTIEEISIDYH